MAVAVLCYAMGSIFAIQKYDPYLEVPTVILTAIFVCCSILPLATYFVVSFRLIFSTAEA
jgi:hypothetical protein